MFEAYSYLRQYNDNVEIASYKEFYKKFSNEREFGGGQFSHYDHLVKNRFMNIYGHISNAVLRRQPKNILDIGCGAGVNLPLANQYRDIEYCGIDYADKALEHSRSIYKNVDFKVMDAFELKFDDNHFHMIIISSVLILYKNLSDRVSILKNAARVLSDDCGVLVVVTWNEAPLLKWCIKLSRLIAVIRNIPLPKDFMAVYLNDPECRFMFNKAGFEVKEKIVTGSYYGALEATQYLTMAKYRRNFGASEKQFGKVKPQNILDDLRGASGSSLLISLLYFLAKYIPRVLGMYSIYILEKTVSSDK